MKLQIQQTKLTKMSILIFLISTCNIQTTFSRPNNKSPAISVSNVREEGYEDLSDRDYVRIKPCINNMATMELCMRCAKVTKSNIVYPMCCSNEDRVFDWCTEYIYYGNTS